MYLQLLTAMELIENRSSYDSDMAIHAHECLDYNRDMTIADYTSLVTDAMHVRDDAVVQMYAFSTATRSPIKSLTHTAYIGLDCGISYLHIQSHWQRNP